jgi:hypothetical protein
LVSVGDEVPSMRSAAAGGAGSTSISVDMVTVIQARTGGRMESQGDARSVSNVEVDMRAALL